MTMTLNVNIPALDRLCDLLEKQGGVTVPGELVTTVEQTTTVEVEAPEPVEKPVEKAEPKPEPKPEPKAEAKPVDVPAIQRAAAELRDQGKLKQVTDMFDEFGIKKLSDLKGEQLQAFAERMRGLGAKL
jgi:outer membrane biosynthesis protein TonB